jgi:hypothetical protein
MYFRSRTPLSFVLGMVIISSCIALERVHADTCSIAGTRPATASDAVVQNGTIRAGTCYNPSDIGISQSAEQAKAYLLGLPRTGSATDNSNIEKENSAFAICAVQFLQEYQKRYGSVTLTSAYRSPAYDAKMCVNNPACGNLMNNPNPMGNHQRGLAMDVRAQADQMTIINFARQNPQFGVCFPFTGEGGGFRDTVHMILVGGPGTEASGPGCRGVTKACSAGNFDPSSVKNADAGLAPPSSIYNNGLQSLGLGAQQPTYAPASQPMMSSQIAPLQSAFATTPTTVSATNGTGICTPQFSCSNNVMYYQTTSCTTQVYQTCSNGCSGNSCTVIAPTTGTSALIATTTQSQAGSTTTLISAFANPVSLSATPIGTAAPISGTLDPSKASSAGNTGTIASIQPISAQQTFTSTDLGANGTGASTISGQSTGLSKILTDLRSALTWALGYLKSLRGT